MNAANPREVKEAKEKEDFALDGQISDLIEVMKTPEGRRTMLMIMNKSGMDSRSYTGNSDTFFKEGARSVGLWIKQILRDNMPDDYIKMISEEVKGENNV